MQFHLRHLFLVTAGAALLAFAVANPLAGVPLALIAAPAGWRWFRWVGNDLPHFNTTDRVIEIVLALGVSFLVELALVFWAGVAAAAAWLAVVIVVTVAFASLASAFDWVLFAALAPATLLYGAVYLWLYRQTLG